MASHNFLDRFKNKTEKIGKNGINSLTASNPIDKSSVLEKKLHGNEFPAYSTSTESKIKIIKKIPIEQLLKEEPAIKSTRTVTPTILPLLRSSPLKPSSTLSQKRAQDSPEKSKNLSTQGSSQPSLNKLPELKAKFYNIRSLLRPS